MSHSKEHDLVGIDPINTRAIFRTLWGSKLYLVLGFTFFLAASIFYALSVPNVYESRAVLAPQTGTGGSSSDLSGALGGLVSMAPGGLSFGAGAVDKSEKARRKMRSLDFFERKIYPVILPDLMAVASWSSESRKLNYNTTIYDPSSGRWLVPPPSAQAAHRTFLAHFTISDDRRSGLTVVTLTHRSPDLAAAWLRLLISTVQEDIRSAEVAKAKAAVAFLTDQMKETTVASLQNVFATLIEEQMKTILLANASDDYVFEPLDPPYVPEIKSSPNRTNIVLLSTFGGFMLVVLMVLAREWRSIFNLTYRE